MKLKIDQVHKTYPAFNAFVALLPGVPLSVFFKIAG